MSRQAPAAGTAAAGGALTLEAVAGVELAAATVGLKASGRPDLVLVRLAESSRTSALFTRNAFCAAPVQVARAHLAVSAPRVLLINSGCANAGTGVAGLDDARATCARAGTACQVPGEAVLPFSTGVIGERLGARVPLERLLEQIDRCAGALAPGADAWHAAADAILTTDTYAKGCSVRAALPGGEVTVTGIAKGSGMIRPDMATMLAFVATDADVEQPMLDELLRDATDASFHRITVDGDTSTNDAVTLSATGASGVRVRTPADRDGLRDALVQVFVELAQSIVRDAEGATRFVEIAVDGGRDEAECRSVAFTVAHSPLVKTALFGGDPNWGRILAAVGRAPVDRLDVDRIDIALGELQLVASGQPVPGYDETRAAAIVTQPEIVIHIGLGRGTAGTRVWTSDLSYDYVRINADYRT